MLFSAAAVPPAVPAVQEEDPFAAVRPPPQQVTLIYFSGPPLLLWSISCLKVLHDGCDGGQDVAQSVAEIIPILLEKNYQFITIDKMWSRKVKEQKGAVTLL